MPSTPAFVFTVRAQYDSRKGGQADTSDTPRSVPTYHFAGLEDFRLPLGCRLVGVEIVDDAIELPSFRHPRQAAYILGSEREGLSVDLQSRCDFVVKIPTRFSVNLGVAGALIMYDRLLTLGRHAPRPVGRRRADRSRAAAGVRRPGLQAQAAHPRAGPGEDMTARTAWSVVLGLMRCRRWCCICSAGSGSAPAARSACGSATCIRRSCRSRSSTGTRRATSSTA